MKNAPIYSVTQVNQYIKGLLDRDGALAGLFVRGELSNYKAYPSGHHYFSLKDAEGAIRCVMFRREAMGLRFRPENGMKVVAFGRVTVFPRDGQYQLYCSELTPDGVGDLHVAFEQLKQKLYQEGLFDPAHKKPIPRYPRKIALITSPAGAAVRDMLRILGARWPLAEVLVLPVRVQGAEAPGELCAAIAWANRHRVADLLITGRGGGSMEDLWAFNDEDVARTIYDRRMLLDYQRDRLAHGLTGAMGRERERFARLAAALDALSPLKVLGRGYAIPQRSDGAVLRSAKEAMPGETLRLRMADGKVSCKVIEPAG